MSVSALGCAIFYIFMLRQVQIITDEFARPASFY